MKKVLHSIGLIRQIDFTFQMEMLETIERMKSKSQDKKINHLEKLFGTRIPLNSTDFVFNKSNDKFVVNRKSIINPRVGRGKIVGEIKGIEENQTRIHLLIKSNYSDFKFVMYSFIFILVLMIPAYYFKQMTLALTISFILFFILLTTLMIIFQLYEMRKTIDSLNDYFERINNKR